MASFEGSALEETISVQQTEHKVGFGWLFKGKE